MTEKRFKVDTVWFNPEKTDGEHTIKEGEQPLIATKSLEDAKFMKDLMNELYEEKEYWKSSCCSQDSFNSILLNELDVAREQGYSVSDPFKKLIGECGDEYENLRNNEELKKENKKFKKRDYTSRGLFEGGKNE